MKVRSPENGFDEIRDLYKDNESSLPEDLDLSFIINKDFASGYLFDDLAGYDSYDFQFIEKGQPELPSLPLSFGDYDIPGPGTDDLNSTAESACHVDVLPDSDEPIKHKSEDTEQLCSHDYIGTSGFQVELKSVDLDLDYEVQKVSRAEFVDDDHIPPAEETVEKTCFEVIQEKMNDFELCFIEQNEASISHFREFLPNSSEYQFDLESEVRHISDSKNLHAANVEPKCADIDENQVYPASLNSLLNVVDSDTSLVQRYQQVECFDQNEDTLLPDHSQQDARLKSGSSHSSGKMSQQLDNSREIKTSSDADACSLQYTEIQNMSVSQDSSISRKRKREVADSSNSQYHKYELDGCWDQDREDTPNSSWQNSTFSQELQQNIQESSSSKQSHAPPRDKYSRRSHKRARRSVSPPFVRRLDRYSEYRKERNRSRSRSPYGRDHPRKRYSPRHRYPSRSYTSRRRSPALFRRTGLGKPGSCLFVAGFCFLTSERELIKKFSRFGRVRDVRIIRDKRSGKSRGYGFLSLERSEEADAAIRAIHKTQWNGRMMLVEKSIPK